MDSLSPREQHVFDVLSSLSSELYGDIACVTNPTLGKCIINNDNYHAYVTSGDFDDQKRPKPFRLILASLRTNIRELAKFITVLAVNRWKHKQTTSSFRTADVVVESPVNVPRSLAGGAIDYALSPDLFNHLPASRSFVYAPRLISTNNVKSILKILELIHAAPHGSITEYDTLSVRDVFAALAYVLRYPFRIAALARKLGRESDRTRVLIGRLLIQSLTQKTLGYYLRYRLGHRLGHLLGKGTHCISWHENQPTNKCFFQGLRQSNPSLRITGHQLFLWEKNLLNIHTDRNELHHGVVPDRIMVNGEYYLRSLPGIHHEVGPSVRYRHIFEEAPREALGKTILILLSYHRGDTLETLAQTRILHHMNADVVYKFHPYTNSANFASQLDSRARVVSNPLNELLAGAGLVIGSGTGSLLEAAACGIPVIIPCRKNRITLNPFPEIGRDEIWHYSHNSEELAALVSARDTETDSERKRRIELARTYRDLLFCDPRGYNYEQIFSFPLTQSTGQRRIIGRTVKG